MPAGIFGDRFLGRRKPAWHRIGQVFEEPMSMSQALRTAGVDFKIEKHPVMVQIDTGENIELVPTNNFAVVREPVADDNEYRVLSIVGKEWTPIQAVDLGKMLDPITEKYPVETIGAIGYGEKIFMTLDAGSSQICGEDHDLYFLVTDHRDGMGALQIAFTPVRVVCQNTLTAGLANAKISVRLTHTRNIESDTAWYMGLFSQMDAAKDEAIAVMDTLSTVTIKDEDVDKVLKAAYPTASQPRRLTLSKDISADDVPAQIWTKLLNDKKALQEEYEKRVERVEIIRNGARERYDAFNDEFSNLARTPWAIWQAVVETEDYRKGHSDSATALFGSRADAKARAFTTARQLVTG
jgi:phage/plasmid-like protein (TIGR03299 family)